MSDRIERLGWLAGMVLVAVVAVVTALGYEPARAFDDDSGGVHEPAIDALAADGVMVGTECGEGLICPDDPILRRDMAVWLVRALDGTEPADLGVQRFVDVDPGHWWAPHVERLAELGITLGCATDPARFLPG